MNLLRISTANFRENSSATSLRGPQDSASYSNSTPSHLSPRASYLTLLTKIKKHTRKGESGYTVVELLVVLGILVIIAGLGLFLSLDTYRSSNFTAGVDGLRVSLERARSRALNNIDESRHGVKVINGNYVIFKGTSYNPIDVNNEVISGGAGFSFTGPDEVVFTQLSGKSNVTGNIVITNGFKTATISLNYAGQIN